MTLYLMDANVPIRAHGDYYPIDRIGPFWEWLLTQAQGGRVKMPRQIYDEVAKSTDLLGQWLRRPEVRKAIVLAEAVDMATVQRVIAEGYAADLNDVELLTLTRDPFLIAAAIGGFRSRRRHARGIEAHGDTREAEGARRLRDDGSGMHQRLRAVAPPRLPDRLIRNRRRFVGRDSTPPTER